MAKFQGRSAKRAGLGGCTAGALRDTGYADKRAKAGFEAIGIEPTRIYQGEDAREFPISKGVDVDEIASHIDGKFMSAFGRVMKPKTFACCCGS